MIEQEREDAEFFGRIRASLNEQKEMLDQIRSSIERCEEMRNVSTATALKFHTPLPRISPQS